jgi:hypothetical protein
MLGFRKREHFSDTSKNLTSMTNSNDAFEATSRQETIACLHRIVKKNPKLCAAFQCLYDLD